MLLSGAGPRRPAGTDLLTANESSIETNANDWTALAGCTKSQSSAQAYVGSNSLEIAVTSVCSARTAAAPSAKSAAEGDIFLFSAQVRTLQSGRSARFTIRWYDAANAQISAPTSVSKTLTANTWTRVNGSLVAPANTAQAALLVNGLTIGSGETMYFDDIHMYKV